MILCYFSHCPGLGSVSAEGERGGKAERLWDKVEVKLNLFILLKIYPAFLFPRLRRVTASIFSHFFTACTFPHVSSDQASLRSMFHFK